MRATHAVDRVRVAIQVAAMDPNCVGLRKTPARPNFEPNIQSRQIPTGIGPAESHPKRSSDWRDGISPVAHSAVCRSLRETQEARARVQIPVAGLDPAAAHGL